MLPTITPIQLRWSDFDSNNHLRHSTYYDFGAMARIQLLFSAGLTEEVMQQMQAGPILFKEECQFKKEVRMTDQLTMHTSLLSCRPAGNRFHFIHEVYNQHKQLTAVLQIWGDFMDLGTRKLLVMPQELTAKMLELPRHSNFQFS